MGEAGDIAVISMPFIAGAAVGMYWQPMPWLAPVLAAACITILWRTPRFVRITTTLLYFLLGMMCAHVHAAAGMHGILLPEPESFPLQCRTRLQLLIASIPFPNEGTAGIITALTTGMKDGVPKEVIQTFRQSGASHILALSGLHLGVIYSIVSKCCSVLGNSRLSDRIRFVTILSFAGFYTLMTGSGPSIVRAFLFIAIRETGRLFSQRSYSAGRCLMAAMLIQVLFNPEVILSAGFQMSYLAMCGIVFLLPNLQKLWEGKGILHWIWDSCCLAVSCQLFTGPVAWFRFHSFPRHFLISNILALPLSSIIMVLAVATITLHACGICPDCLPVLLDRAVCVLLWVLETVSAIGYGAG